MIKLTLLSLFLTFTGFCYTPPMENQGRMPDAAEAAPLLKAICGNGGKVEGSQMYCSPCPDVAGLPGLMTEHFRLRFVVNGSFTSEGAQELLAFFEGCELLPDNFGGVALLERAGDGWKLSRYDPSVKPAAVHIVRQSSGHDLLFCAENFVGMGLVIDSLYTFDFAQQPALSRQTIFKVSDTTRACGYDARKASLDKVTWNGQNFSATVTWGLIKSTPEYLRDCPDKVPYVPTQTYQMQFIFDGVTFHPAPESLSTFNQLNIK